MKKIDRVYLDSSMLEWVQYFENEHKLVAGFLNGSVYEYHEVPASVYDELLSASSHGNYFYYNIRTTYSNNPI